eukprot:4511621-Prymnesium_polylepis.2
MASLVASSTKKTGVIDRRRKKATLEGKHTSGQAVATVLREQREVWASLWRTFECEAGTRTLATVYSALTVDPDSKAAGGKRRRHSSLGTELFPKRPKRQSTEDADMRFWKAETQQEPLRLAFPEGAKPGRTQAVAEPRPGFGGQLPVAMPADAEPPSLPSQPEVFSFRPGPDFRLKVSKLADWPAGLLATLARQSNLPDAIGAVPSAQLEMLLASRALAPRRSVLRTAMCFPPHELSLAYT